ncbi:hypothetical protein, partial [Roseinatronobacter sp.]|uniref:hypothetical protein n=1 Tax=Roseinatronobacter sp. TaxID=1945755 RepID=UPI003F719617
YAGYGTDFKILSEIAGKHGNRAEHCSYEWQGEYELMFEESGIASDMFLDELYERINEEFKSMIGLPTK